MQEIAESLDELDRDDLKEILRGLDRPHHIFAQILTTIL